jgi:hypothetical protein
MSTKKDSRSSKKNEKAPTPYGYTDADIASAIKACREILALDIMRLSFRGITQKALFTELIINLNDLVQKAADAGHRIAFRDDIDPALALDVTDLINKVRICCCHLSTPQRLAHGAKLSWNLSYHNVSEQVLNGQESTIPTTDVHINFGIYMLHFERHVVRAFREAETFFVDVQKKPEILRFL